tara:strand:- start:15830 stop:16462 length:633 start_codon:yes stop_codon:yes gene_type:complete
MPTILNTEELSHSKILLLHTWKTAIAVFFFIMLVSTSNINAQFEEPVIKKVSIKDAAVFEAEFKDIKWTGQGFNYNQLDRVPAIELRARLESVFGEPTKTIEDIVERGKLRAGKAIQFEYWFIVDGEIPMMILDLDGPFADGLVYVGASRYIDLMPAVKRSLTRQLLETEPKAYIDYFYSPEREQWYEVCYQNGIYTKKEVDKPSYIRLY